jgi:putative mRNA 3-end processing factor
MPDLIRVEKAGLYCEQGDFYIDPWQPVQTALITHAHGDHARTGSMHYISSRKSVPILNHRLGEHVPIDGREYGERIKLGNTWVSFHSAGHILGSSQIRVEHKDEVWVASGDYKRTPDPSCDPFDVQICDHFISEATFAIPIYNWQPGHVVAKQIYDWWFADQDRPTMLFCYALGKAQRVLAELCAYTDRKIFLHGAISELTNVYRQAGIKMLPTAMVTDMPKDYSFKGDLILAPPSAHRSPWMKRFKEPQTAFASGWMQVRGNRRRKGYEKGFVLSDHADWNELNQTIRETTAKTVYLTHGRTDVLARYLKEQSINVSLLQTEYDNEEEDAS